MTRDATCRVLLVEDNPGDAVLVGEMLPAGEFSVDHVETLEAASEALSRNPYDLILLDLGLPDAKGTEGVTRLAGEFPEVALVVLTGLQHDEMAVKAVRAGAQDYLVKGMVPSEQVPRALRYALARKEIELHKSRFLATVSHEMRTPLHFMLGFATCLQDEVGGPLTEQQRRFVSGILEGIDRLTALVDDLLDSAQIMAGKLSLTRQTTEFDALLTQAVDAMRPLADGKGIDLRIEENAGIRLPVDARRMVQVLTNLLSNAIKYTGPGGQIRIRSKLTGSGLRTEVSDTGVGIPEAYQQRLFQRFSQVPALNGSAWQKGTGLGLSISKAIVEGHDGEIGVKSKPGEGSTFWFTLPVPRDGG